MNTLKTTTDDVISKLSKILEESGAKNAVEESGMCKEGVDGVTTVGQHTSVLEDTTSEQHYDLCQANGCSGPIFKCQLPGLDYVLFVRGSGPHAIEYDFTHDKPLKEVIVSRKCAESVLRGAQVYYDICLKCSTIMYIHTIWFSTVNILGLVFSSHCQQLGLHTVLVLCFLQCMQDLTFCILVICYR